MGRVWIELSHPGSQEIVRYNGLLPDQNSHPKSIVMRKTSCKESGHERLLSFASGTAQTTHDLGRVPTGYDYTHIIMNICNIRIHYDVKKYRYTISVNTIFPPPHSK